MQFRLLGPIEVRSDEGSVRIGSRMQRRLLAVLLIQARTVVAADRLIDILWGRQPPVDARQSLWTCVARLRRALADPAGMSSGDLLMTRPPGYLLSARPDEIDASQFESLLSAASGIMAEQPRTAAEMLDKALGLWRGAALEEFADEQFAIAEAARLEELRLTAGEDRFDIDLVLGDHDMLIGRLGRFTADHPLRERPRAQLMLALYRCGRQAEALESYRRFRDLLNSELGLEPSELLRSQQEQILRQASELDWRAPASREIRAASAAGPPLDPVGATDQWVPAGSRLPPEMTSFVGRERDVAATIAAVADAPLVTLTGAGGVGKTRLALRAAARAATGFADGVVWCELAPVTDPDAVAAALATSLGIRRGADATVVESILTFLSDKKSLLLLDNCEHLLISVRKLVTEILRRCPLVVVLATSRERLAMQGEQVLPVAPLALPEPDRELEWTAPSMALFIDRARAVRPDLKLDATTLRQVADICRHLDGLPLALELAAARMRSLNPADIAERVRTRLDLLTSGRAHSGRHETLRGVIDWSYDLLAADTRQLFDRLSVFAGSFDLTAAEAVCTGRGIERHQVVDLLTSLVDASMINVGGTEDLVRYSMLETLRHYGADHLSADPQAAKVNSAYALHFAHVAEQADQGLRGPDEALWVKVVDRELDNLRAACRWMMECEQTDTALRLSRGLRYYMLFRFRDEVVTWGETSLGLPEAVDHPLFAEVAGAVGEGLTVRGEMGAARALAEHALAQFSDLEDGRRMYPLRVVGMVDLYVGQLSDAFHTHAEMCRLAREHDHPYEAGMALLGLAQSRTYGGDPHDGLRYAEEQLRVVKPLDNPSMLSLAWYDQAEALSTIDVTRAIEAYQRAIRLAESAGSTFVEGIALVGMASLLGRSEEPSIAFPLFRSIIGRWRRMGVWHHQWTTLRNLVQLFLRTENWETAAVLLGATTAANRAARAFGADAHLIESAADRLREALGSSRWLAARDRGAAMSGQQVVSFACDAIDRVQSQARRT